MTERPGIYSKLRDVPHLTVSGKCAFGLGQCRKKTEEKSVGTAARFHLEDMEKRYPSQIQEDSSSAWHWLGAGGGTRILLLDEPFSAWDEHLKTHMQKEMLESLEKFRGTTLFVTHNMAEAYRLCDRIVILNNGRVETFGSKQEVFQRPASLATAKITGCRNTASAVRRSEHSAEVPEWGVRVNIAAAVESESGFIGIRENNINLADDSMQENCFPVWIADESEALFRTILYLKIGSVPKHPGDFHIQWDIGMEERAAVGRLPQPFWICMNPQHIFFMPR